MNHLLRSVLASPGRSPRPSPIPTSLSTECVHGTFSLHDFSHSNQRTRNQFRPRTTGKGGATSYQLRQYAEATLGGGSLRKVVKLPEGEDENEWLAVNSEYPLGTGRDRS